MTKKYIKIFIIIVLIIILAFVVYFGTEKAYEYWKKPYERKISDRASAYFDRLKDKGDSKAIQKTIDWLLQKDHVSSVYFSGQTIDIRFDSDYSTGFSVINYWNSFFVLF